MYRSINESDEEMKAIFPRPLKAARMVRGWGRRMRWMGSRLLIRNLARQMKNEGNKQKIKAGDGRCDNRTRINHRVCPWKFVSVGNLRWG